MDSLSYVLDSSPKVFLHFYSSFPFKLIPVLGRMDMIVEEVEIVR